MREQLTYIDALTPIIKQAKHSIYKNYGSMLLGYIQEVVKDIAVAEQLLIDIFNELNLQEIETIERSGSSAFVYLQQFTRKKLATFISAVEGCGDKQKIQEKKTIQGNKFIDMMGHEQRHVFCGLHYHGKTTTQLAAELNKPEDSIRQLLKEAFTIIRNHRYDRAVY